MPRLEKWDADMIVISGPYAIRTLDGYDVHTSCENVSELAEHMYDTYDNT